MELCQKYIVDKLKDSGWNYVKWYDNSTNLVPGYTKPLILIAQQYSNIDGFKLEVAVILMIPLVDYSKTALDIFGLYDTIKSVERNRDSFLKELIYEHKLLPNCDIYDCKTTSFSVKLGCYESDGMFILLNASSGLLSTSSTF
ncbi:hypothetical protein EWB00_007007 [Schistosoma japonicum]|uniref:SJCHGC05666 protein n=1 Tax=Schistosoma japonicum TaxID=6182 RepID=Q5DAF9_SCHJA|nr:SJCHGC05666 protein [Schistosoma japonicum]KAH8855531.1 hypothetical protein KSF78_0002044 [Schistosoma japonicum]TNN08474.1 hypothetical protein EWB00_007007 [Schistosoma japonicum]